MLIWILLIVVESTRFKTSRDFSEKPIITIIETENLKIYKGLGYTVQYNINDDKSIYGVSFLFSINLCYGHGLRNMTRYQISDKS